MNDRIAKQAYDRGYDDGLRARTEWDYVAVNPYRKTRWGNGRDGLWEDGCQDGWAGRPRKITQGEADEREWERVRALEQSVRDLLQIAELAEYYAPGELGEFPERTRQIIETAKALVVTPEEGVPS